MALVTSSYQGLFKVHQGIREFTSMCEELVPSPVENAKQKVEKIYRGTCDTVRYEDIATRMAGCSK